MKKHVAAWSSVSAKCRTAARRTLGALGLLKTARRLLARDEDGRPLRPVNASQLHQPMAATLSLTRVQNLSEYETHLKSFAAIHRERWRVELDLCKSGEPFKTAGTCFACEKTVEFETDFQYSSHVVNGIKLPNWRERVMCPCQLSNRTRAAVHILQDVLGARPSDHIYVAEQVTPLYATLQKRFPMLVGSEYLGERIPFGHLDARGVRNESINRLTFGDGAFEYALNFDVLEHVPEPTSGLSELYRILKPDGQLLLSVPFLQNQHGNRPRARVEANGEIEYLLPALYHGDPVSEAGCLCFQDFGWELLDQMRGIGFRDVSMLLYWSQEYGYYGVEQMMISARR
jgi:hypothetical protein